RSQGIPQPGTEPGLHRPRPAAAGSAALSSVPARVRPPRGRTLATGSYDLLGLPLPVIPEDRRVQGRSRDIRDLVPVDRQGRMLEQRQPEGVVDELLLDLCGQL